MHRALRGLIAAIVTGGLALGLPAPAGAVPSRQWPVTPAALGSLYGSVTEDFASLRIWGPAAWCYIQPTPDADIEGNLEALVAPQLDQVAAAGGTATLTIGHPPPWVFENHPDAVRKTPTWSCGDHAAGRAIPSLASLKPRKDGSRSVQAQRLHDYVSRVIDYLDRRYQGRVPIVLELWNEPNIPAGLEPGMPIPGSARTAKEAALSLHAYDAIAFDLIRQKRATSWLSLASSTTILRWDTFTKTYFAAHNRSRKIDAVHFNLYSYNIKSVDAAVKKWDKRAALATTPLRTYRKLRNLPIRLSEVNLNLINHDSPANIRPSFANEAAQRRMATSTQMNAYFHGISAMRWLIPWRNIQTAVHVQTVAGNPAHDALVVLHRSLLGSTSTGCRQVTGVRMCRFRAPDGTRTVMWRLAGSSVVRSPHGGELLDMAGASRPVRKGQKIRIDTTPVVIRPVQTPLAAVRPVSPAPTPTTPDLG
jgi:hypothetical protein